MADKNYQSELSHLTSLDFDISAIPKQLEKIQADLEQTAREIAAGEQYKLKVDVDSQEMVNDVEEIKKKFSGITKDLSDKGFAGEFAKSKDELEKIKEEVKSLAGEYSNLAKVQLKVTSKGKVTGATLTYDDDAGRKIISNYKLQVKYNEEIVDGVQTYDRVWKNTSNNVIDNIKQREIAEEKARQKRENNYKKELANIDNIIQKQKQLIATIQSQPTSKENRAILQEATANLENLNKVREATAKTRIFTDVDQKNVSDYSAKVKDLETSFKATGNGANNFLKTITDKARWLTAFYLINGLKDAFIGSVKTIKGTEDAVVELQRVLNEDVAQTEISDQLYKIAQNYGRSFTEVSETAVKFAQTGKSWNETLKATEATMLAVNTAELEVNTATTGLIAVMSQFNLKADEMQSLIDKINITADNFAVTSEKIVAALQRAGSSAVNANLSLEDTIALITTLSEATGRSGENIGTALNSLLIYTSKTKALETFYEVGNETVKQTVDAYNKGAGSIIDVWSALSKQLKSLGEEQQQNLANAIYGGMDGEAFAKDLEQNATEITDDIKSIYGTAGTFRQNYFIALLNNLDTYTETMGKMTQAEGYSLTENEKAMSTLTRQWQILVETAKELSVQFGEQMLLRDLKVFISVATGILKVTKDIGGLKTALYGLITIFAVLKKSQILLFWKEFKNYVWYAKTAIIEYTTSVVTATGASAKFAAVVAPIGTLFKSLGVGGTIGLAITALSIFNGLIDKSNAKIREMIEKNLEVSNAITEQTRSVISLVNEYERYNALPEEQQSKQKLLELQNKITEATKETYSIGEDVEKPLKEQIKDRNILLLKEQTSQENMNKLEIAAQQAGNEIKRAFSPSLFDLPAQKQYGLTEENLTNIESLLVGSGKSAKEAQKYIDNFLNAKSLKDKRKALVDIQTAIKNVAESAIKDQATQFIAEMLEKYKNIVDEAKNAQENFAEGNLNKYFADVTQSTILTSEQLEEYIKLQNANTNLSNEQRSANIEYARSYYELQNAISNTAIVTQNYTFDLEKLKEVSKGLNEQIDSTQSSFDTLFGIMEEYNSTGTLTADMLQKILSLEGEYSNLLNITADGISLNENATNNLINSKQDLLQKTLATNTAIQLETLAQSLLKEQQDENSNSAGSAIEANDDLATSIYKVLNSATGGAIAMQEFASAVKEYGTGVGLEGDFQAKYEEQSKKILSNYQQIFKEIGEVGKTQSFWQSKTSNASKKANDEAKKALQEQKNLVKEKYDTEISKIKEAQEANKKKYNAQIDKLKKVEKENDRIRKKEEFERNRQASLKDLAQAEARSGVEYREQEFDIQEKINDENRKWQEQLEDWELEDRISKLEKLRDAENERLAEQIKSLEKLRDTETKALEEQIKALEGTLAQTAVTSSTQMATAYKDNFIEPVKEETTKVFTNSYDTLLESNTEFAKKVKEIYSINLFEPLKTEFATVFGTDFTDLAEINSKQMYKIYSENFTTKFKRDIKSIFESTLTASNYVLQNNRNQVTYGYQPQGLSTTNYNSNRSMNVVANVNSASGANKLSNDLNRIFNNSTLPY